MGEATTKTDSLERILFQDSEAFLPSPLGNVSVGKFRGIATPQQRKEIEKLFDYMSIAAELVLQPINNRTVITLRNVTDEQRLRLCRQFEKNRPSNGETLLHFPPATILKERAELLLFSQGWKIGITPQEKVKLLKVPVGGPMYEAMEDILQANAQKKGRTFLAFDGVKIDDTSCWAIVEKYIYDDVIKPIIDDIEKPFSRL